MIEVDTRRGPSAPGPLAAFARFVLCGGGVGVASSAGVSWLAALMPWAVANALITVVSTLLCTELHALFTFGTGQRAGWRRHLQSAGSATAAYAVTSAAVLILQAVRPAAGALYEQAVYLGAAGLAGLGRFLVLRLCVFAVRTRTTAPVKETMSVSVGRRKAPTRVVTCGARATTVRDSARRRIVRHPSVHRAGVLTDRTKRPLARAYGGTGRPSRHVGHSSAGGVGADSEHALPPEPSAAAAALVTGPTARAAWWPYQFLGRSEAFAPARAARGAAAVGTGHRPRLHAVPFGGPRDLAAGPPLQHPFPDFPPPGDACSSFRH
jgi:putative flippase GtrA